MRVFLVCVVLTTVTAVCPADSSCSTRRSLQSTTGPSGTAAPLESIWNATKAVKDMIKTKITGLSRLAGHSHTHSHGRRARRLSVPQTLANDAAPAKDALGRIRNMTKALVNSAKGALKGSSDGRRRRLQIPQGPNPLLSIQNETQSVKDIIKSRLGGLGRRMQETAFSDKYLDSLNLTEAVKEQIRSRVPFTRRRLQFSDEDLDVLNLTEAVKEQIRGKAPFTRRRQLQSSNATTTTTATPATTEAPEATTNDGPCQSPCTSKQWGDCVVKPADFAAEIDMLAGADLRAIANQTAYCRHFTSRDCPESTGDCEYNKDDESRDASDKYLDPFWGPATCRPTIDCGIHGDDDKTACEAISGCKWHGHEGSDSGEGDCRAEWTSAYEDKLVGEAAVCKQFVPLFYCESLPKAECDADQNCEYRAWGEDGECAVKDSVEEALEREMDDISDLSMCGPHVRCRHIGLSLQETCEADLACGWYAFGPDAPGLGVCFAHPAVLVAHPDFVDLSTDACKAKYGFHAVPWNCMYQSAMANDGGKTCYADGACTLLCEEWTSGGLSSCTANETYLYPMLFGEEFYKALDMVDRMDACQSQVDDQATSPYEEEVTTATWLTQEQQFKEKCPNMIDPRTVTVDTSSDPLPDTIARAQTAAAFEPPSKCLQANGCKALESGACVPDAANFTSRVNALSDSAKDFLLKGLECANIETEGSCTGDCQWVGTSCNMKDDVAMKLLYGVDSCGPGLDCITAQTKDTCLATPECHWDESDQECEISWSAMRDAAIGTDGKCEKYAPLVECGRLTAAQCNATIGCEYKSYGGDGWECEAREDLRRQLEKEYKKEEPSDLRTCGPEVRCHTMANDKSLCNRDKGCFHIDWWCGYCGASPVAMFGYPGLFHLSNSGCKRLLGMFMLPGQCAVEHYLAEDDGKTCLSNGACELWCSGHSNETECRANTTAIGENLLRLSAAAEDLYEQMVACGEAYESEEEQWWDSWQDPKMILINTANTTELERAVDYCGTLTDPNTVTQSTYEQSLTSTVNAASDAGTYTPTAESMKC
ncbi:unnamed protein product [Vitrella brassicaformis CCMP3155]|uniref:SRCR domain-containing protein n=3 Tax=Vitrella brassicaformis TaxID=1169539 RepID=A0A0G4F850_VITBC|nr:unnamed protein product [Vitrella brassicaformis CCMP3155]|eukprot:CEM08884.1 unnamed protein product [Vitrella brassicaformis CCMP3155]